MKIRHPTLKNCSSISSHGSVNLDEKGEAEVSPEHGAHLLKCGFLAVEAPADPWPGALEKVAAALREKAVTEAELPVEEPKPPVETPPATPKAKTKRK